MSWTRQSVAVSVLAAMDDHRKQAGIRAAALRDAKGWSQEELAQYAKISSRTVSRFENGRHDGRRGTVRSIAKALGVNETDVLGPPPDPLGLGAETQLDRIENQQEVIVDLLTRLLSGLAGEPLDELERALEVGDQLDEQPLDSNAEDDEPPAREDRAS